MTTMAALLGGVPLMLGTGTGSELRQPLGYAMVGGLLVSQIADALHDAGRLSLSRPAAALAQGRRAGAARTRRLAGGMTITRRTRERSCLQTPQS